MHLLRSVAVSAFWISLFWTSAAAAACDATDEDGANVALVLSGGGALASTQVGALKVIEEAGVPIHCVVGTSMGSVVGALYAAGYSAGEIEEIFTDSDWAAVFQNQTPRQDKPFIQKESDDRYFSNYVAGLDEKGGIKLPSGLRSMAGLKRHFRQLLINTPLGQDFNELPIPYRAVAMDLSTGEAVAFKEGDLVEAMLASMAVPGAFGPREIDGRAFVDGGMAAQLPVEIAKAMGADIVIALDTTVPPEQVAANASLAEVTQQLIRLTVYQNQQKSRAALGERDLFIQPDLTGLSPASFEKAALGIERGIAEAEKFQDKLAEIKAAAAPALVDRPRPNAAPDLTKPLTIANNSAINSTLIDNRFSAETLELADAEKTTSRLNDLAAFGAFGEVDLAAAEDNSPVLTVRERPLGRTLLQAGFRASTTFDGDSAYAVLARISRRPFSPRGGELSLSAELGTNFDVTAALTQPYGEKGRFFVSPQISYRAEEVIVNIGDFRVGEFWQQTATGSVRVGRELGQWGVIALTGGANIGRLSAVVVASEQPFEPVDYAQGGAGLLFAVDTFDQANWPSRGVQLRLEAERRYDFGDAAKTDIYDLSFAAATKINGVGLWLRSRAQSVREENNEPVQILNLGGFRRLSAAPENTLPTNEYVLTTLELYQRLTAADRVLNFPVYIGATIEHAFVEFDFLEAGARGHFSAGSIYLGAETIVGPAFFGAGFSEEGNYSLFLHLGRAF